MKTICLALVLTLVACGKSTDVGKLSNLPAVGSAAQTVDVRVLGVGASGPVRARVATVELTVDGRALPAQVTGAELDLGNDQNAWQVARFSLPADARSVAINLQFHPEGIVERNGKTLPLVLSGAPISLVVDAAQLRTRSKVVLEIDLARSLIDRCEQALLLPDFIVRF